MQSPPAIDSFLHSVNILFVCRRYYCLRFDGVFDKYSKLSSLNIQEVNRSSTFHIRVNSKNTLLRRLYAVIQFFPEIQRHRILIVNQSLSYMRF